MPSNVAQRPNHARGLRRGLSAWRCHPTAPSSAGPAGLRLARGHARDDRAGHLGRSAAEGPVAAGRDGACHSLCHGGGDAHGLSRPHSRARDSGDGGPGRRSVAGGDLAPRRGQPDARPAPPPDRRADGRAEHACRPSPCICRKRATRACADSAPPSSQRPTTAAILPPGAVRSAPARGPWRGCSWPRPGSPSVPGNARPASSSPSSAWPRAHPSRRRRSTSATPAPAPSSPPSEIALGTTPARYFGAGPVGGAGS